jgi:hypothetical protein
MVQFKLPPLDPLGLPPMRVETEPPPPDRSVTVEHFKDGKKQKEELFATPEDVLAAFPDAKKVKDKYRVE